MSVGRFVAAALAAVLMLGFWASGVQAESAAGGEEHKTDIFRVALDLGIWTVVVFLILLVVLRKFAWGAMLEGLNNREQRIRGAIDEARRTREEAQRLREQFQQEMDHAAEKVREILEEARRDAEQTGADLIAKARAEGQAERDRYRREIEMARDQALQQIWNQTADMASLVSAKVLRRQLTPDDHRRLVDETLAELKTTAAGNGSRA